MKPLSIHKICNAFITDEILSELMGKEVYLANHPVVNRLGGLWIAGTLTVDDAWVIFIPKGIEQAPELKQEGVRIALASLGNVKWKFGLLSGIVILTHTKGEFRFRCFGAWQVVRAMAAHIGK